jgi:hypothetical protein
VALASSVSESRSVRSVECSSEGREVDSFICSNGRKGGSGQTRSQKRMVQGQDSDRCHRLRDFSALAEHLFPPASTPQASTTSSRSLLPPSRPVRKLYTTNRSNISSETRYACHPLASERRTEHIAQAPVMDPLSLSTLQDSLPASSLVNAEKDLLSSFKGMSDFCLRHA